MAPDSPRRIDWNVALMIGVVFGFTVEVTVAQVLIEERVVIQEDSAFVPVDSVGKVATSVSWIEPEFDGYLLLYYAAGSKLSEPIDPQAEVMVEINDVLAARDTVMQSNRLVYNTSGPNNNQYCMPYSTLEHYYSQGPSATWRVGHVDKGDKVQVGYDPKEDYQVASFYDYDGAVWDIDIYHPNCYAPSIRYDERLLLAAVVVRDTLTVEIDEPKSVWPWILKEKIKVNIDSLLRGAPTSFDFTTVLDSIGVTITLRDEGSSVEGVDVSLAAEWVDGSGGHSHADPAPPTGWMKFRDLANPSQKVDDAITVTTDVDGKAQVRFFAPPWGGRARIRATAVYNSEEVTDVDSLTIKVPNLELLSSTPGFGSIGLIGGTCQHHGPGGSGACASPDNNHYALQSTNETLVAINDWWQAEAPPPPIGSSSQSPIQVNDMSLPFGGKFQVDGIWAKARGHQYHRLGRDVDLRTQRADKLRVGIYVEDVEWEKPGGGTVGDRANKKFELWVNEAFEHVAADVHAKGLANEHYHLFFY